MRSIAHQSVIDLAVQIYGSALSALDLAVENGMSVTDTVQPDTEIKIGDSNYQNIDIRDYFGGRKILIATAPFTPPTMNFELPGELPLSL